MPQIPVLSDNRVGTARRGPNYERPLDVSQQQRQTAVTLGVVQEATNLVEDRIAQDDAMRVQAAITEEWGKFNAAERVNSQGRNAEGHAERVAEWWGKAASEYGEAVTPRAQKMVGHQLQRAKASALADASVFQEVQLNKSHAEAMELAQKALVNQGVADANEAAGITGLYGAAQAARVALQNIRTNAEAFAKTQGKPPEWVEAQVLAASTDVHNGVIQRLMIDDPTAANAYYKEHKGQIDSRLYDNLDKQLVAANAANDATNEVDKVWKSAGPKTLNDPVAVTTMLEQIRETFKTDPNRRKLAEAELRQRVVEHNAAQSEFTAANTNGALGVFQKTNSLAAVQKSEEYNRLSPKEQLGVTSYITNFQASLLSKQSAALNRDEAAIRREMAQQDRAYLPAYNALSDPELLRTMSRNQVSALQTQIGPRLTQDLLRVHDSITKSDDKFTAAKATREQMDVILVDMGFTLKSKDKNEQAKMGAVRSRMTLALDAIQQDAKNKMTPEQMETVMREEAARTVTIKSGFLDLFQEDVPIVALTPEEIRKVRIPFEQIEPLRAQMAVKRAKYPNDPMFYDTPQNLQMFYLARQKSLTFGYIPEPK